MENQRIHILNGDALLQRFPSAIEGEVIVMRECLMDGPVHAANEKAFYRQRFEFLQHRFPNLTYLEYHNKVISQFDLVKQITSDQEVFFWFEDDLFCQVNLWFAIHLLAEADCAIKPFLIRPSSHSPYSFAGMSDTELVEAFQNRKLLSESELQSFSLLYQNFKNNKLAEMLVLGAQLAARFDQVPAAIEAHADRHGPFGGRPIQLLKEIMEELNTLEFKPVFTEFSQRAGIYGFGDIQVRHMLEKIKLDGA